MSCKKCVDADNDNQITYYRWGAARVGIIACEEHGLEIIEALDEAQKD